MGAAIWGRPYGGGHIGGGHIGGGHMGAAIWGRPHGNILFLILKMNIVRKLDLTTVAAAGGANSLSTARGQGDADDGQVLATERPSDGLMPPRKKRRGSARQQTALSALVADSAGVGGADTQHRLPGADEIARRCSFWCRQCQVAHRVCYIGGATSGVATLEHFVSH